MTLDEIKNLIIDSKKTKGERVNKDSKIYIYLLVFNRIKLFKKDIRHIGKQNIKFQNKDIDIKLLKDMDLKIDYIDLVQEINLYFKKIDLNIQIGTEDVACTAILTGILSALLGGIIKKQKFNVIPIYGYGNLIKIKLNCIFSIHLMQYINKIFSNKLKGLEHKKRKEKVEV